MLFGLFWLGWDPVDLVRKLDQGARPTLFLTMTPPPGSSGGLAMRSPEALIMAAAGTLIGTPVGMMAGIYLAEFGGRGWLAP